MLNEKIPQSTRTQSLPKGKGLSRFRPPHVVTQQVTAKVLEVLFYKGGFNAIYHPVKIAYIYISRKGQQHM